MDNTAKMKIGFYGGMLTILSVFLLALSHFSINSSLLVLFSSLLTVPGLESFAAFFVGILEFVAQGFLGNLWLLGTGLASAYVTTAVIERICNRAFPLTSMVMIRASTVYIILWIIISLYLIISGSKFDYAVTSVIVGVIARAFGKSLA